MIKSKKPRINYEEKIKQDYFEKIDTKEKAYWLGLLFADGWISSYKKGIGIKITKKDSILLVKFCKALGLSSQRIKSVKDSNTLRVRFLNRKISFDLINHRFIVGKNKSNNLEFPELDNFFLELAFLLGYYDGDGTQNTTKITSGSKKFLQQIKKNLIFLIKFI